ncbi:glycine-rich domain-containing protein [Pseudomonas sp. LB3P25]
MSQHDMTVDNGAGVAVRADINLALKALASQSSGASAPSPTYPAQMWADTGTGRLRQRDSANTLWIDLGPLDSARPAPGSLLNVRVFSTPGTFTYTETPGTKKVIPWVQSAGGAGGGAPATNSGQASVGAGGGAGAYAQSLFTSGFSGVSITVGAGGTGVSGAAGNNGGPSSFGALVSCPGGRGGPTAGPGTPIFSSSSINSSAPSGGNITSCAGSGSVDVIALALGNIIGGIPGASLFGPGANLAAAGINGTTSTSPGSGGGATANTISKPAVAGGAGAPGIVIVWEYA